MVATELRQQIDTAVMSRGEVSTRNMMGTTAYFARGRMFAFWVADGLVVKLSDRVRQDFIDRKQGALFQGPQGRGFGEWTRLDLAKQDDVAAALEAAKHAHEYVRGTAAKTAARAKTRRKSKR